MRFGLAYSGMFPVGDLVEVARAVDGGPIEGIWLLEHLGYRDAFVPAAAVLGATRHLMVVPTAVSPYARNPMLVAMQMATLAELARRRADLVLAAGNSMAYGESGMEQPRPVAAMEEYVGILRAFWSGDRVQRAGSVFHVTGATFHVPVEPAPGIHVAATRERMLELAGRVADGVLLSAALSPDAIRRSLELVRRGAVAAARQANPPSLGAVVLVSAGSTRDQAVEEARVMLSYLLRTRSRSAPIPGERLPMDLEALSRAWERRDLVAARALVPDQIVEVCSVAGTPADCRAGLARYAEMGLDTIVLLPVSGAAGIRRALEVVGSR